MIASTQSLQEMNNKTQAIFEEIKTPHEQGVVLRPTGIENSFDSQLVDNPHVFHKDNHWYMTYVGHDGKGYRTGLASSSDLLSWERMGLILDHGADDNDWDLYNAGGYIVRDHQWGTAPTLHRFKGEYIMLYLGSSEPGYEIGKISIGLARAQSLMGPWKRHPEPVITPLDNDLERGAIWKIFTLPLDGRYLGFFPVGSYKVVGHEWMSMAYSVDLINWEREVSNPVLARSTDNEGKVWGERQTGDCEVFKIDDTWVMVYFTDSPHGVIDSFAISEDLVRWQPSHMPLRRRNLPYNSTYAHKPCIFKYEGVVYHFYNAVGDEGRVIALATSKPL